MKKAIFYALSDKDIKVLRKRLNRLEFDNLINKANAVLSGQAAPEIQEARAFLDEASSFAESGEERDAIRDYRGRLDRAIKSFDAR